MFFSTRDTDNSALYKLLTGTIIPRPIGWISTVDSNGVNNLAPFSFFNAVSHDPPCVMFSTVRPGNKNKDSLNNVLNQKEFAVNLVTEELCEKMNETSTSFAPNEDEFAKTALTPIACEFIKCKRVKESLVNMECKMVHHYFTENHKDGGACIVIGEVLAIHVADEILMEKQRINLEKYKPVARLAGSNYAKLGEIFKVKRR